MLANVGGFPSVAIVWSQSRTEKWAHGAEVTGDL